MINFKFFILSNYSLTKQLLLVNLIAALIGFITIVLINIFLINSDNSIDNKINDTLDKLGSATNFIENNSIARVPLFKNCRINNLIDESCKAIDNTNSQIKLSALELEPTSAQEYIIQNLLEPDVNISIYNNNMIEIINSSTLFIGNRSASDITFLEISDTQENSEKRINLYLNYYLKFFNFIYAKLTREKYINDIVKKKHAVKIFKETNKKRKLISHKYIDKDDNIIHLSSVPIINNDKVYGIIIASLIINEKNNNLGLTSFILFNFYVLSIFVTILLSLFYIRDLIVPLKKLSEITLYERKKIRSKLDYIYPNRKDEIGILSNEIQNMSKDLKLQINQIEKFTTDVAHELKNPLTAIKSSSELLLKKNISEENKNKVLKNFNKEVDRMNKLISDISNFSRTISEIEAEKFEVVDLNKFLKSFVNDYMGNHKNIELQLELDKNELQVLLNKDKLLQVILNLIENSISLAFKNTMILLKLMKINDHTVELKIYDQGNGINLKDKDKIFERFYTDRQHDRDEHSGLGLSISREIIKTFDGTIELTKSDNLYFSGACFIIKLPLRTI